MDADLKDLEQELERLVPEALPEGFIARMEAAMDGWQEVEREEKVVPFPAQAPGSRGVTGGLWKAAAAVALLGASVALLVPAGQQVSTTVVNAPVPENHLAWNENKVAPVAFEPMSAERDVVRAESQGVVMMSGNAPHRCVRVEYLDRYEFEGENGQELRVSKPAVDFILIPVQPD